MAGLDKQGSPFSQPLPESSKGHNRISQLTGGATRPTHKSSTLPSKFSKPAPQAKTTGYYGDISSSNCVKSSYGSFEEEQPIGFASVADNDNVRPPSYFNGRGDPTMKAPAAYEDSYQEGRQPKRDELYERILQDTSGVFGHLGEGGAPSLGNDSVLDQDVDNGKIAGSDPAHLTADKTGDNKNPASKPRSRRPNTDDGSRADDSVTDKPHSRADSPEKGGDVNYSMDSFDQSYVSERGERIMGLDSDLYASSPSPTPHVGGDSAEDTF